MNNKFRDILNKILYRDIGKNNKTEATTKFGQRKYIVFFKLKYLYYFKLSY